MTAVRARDLGIPFTGEPGEWNSITDVGDVAVGYTTLVSGDGLLVRGPAWSEPGSPPSCRGVVMPSTCRARRGGTRSTATAR